QLDLAGVDRDRAERRQRAAAAGVAPAHVLDQAVARRARAVAVTPDVEGAAVAQLAGALHAHVGQEARPHRGELLTALVVDGDPLGLGRGGGEDGVADRWLDLRGRGRDRRGGCDRGDGDRGGGGRRRRVGAGDQRLLLDDLVLAGDVVERHAVAADE